MKKVIISILLISLLSSCSLFKKDEEKIEITSSWEINIENENNNINIDENEDSITSSWITSSWESVKINENGTITVWDDDIKIDTQTDVSVEKDIENIIDTNSENTKDNVTEEEILNDIDSLINDIIKSAENG